MNYYCESLLNNENHPLILNPRMSSVNANLGPYYVLMGASIVLMILLTAWILFEIRKFLKEREKSGQEDD